MARGREKFTDFRRSELGGTLAQRLIPVADRLRDLRVRFGLRTYRVSVIRTRWTEGRRGAGTEIIVHQMQVLPTPLVSDLTGLALNLSPAFLDETGSIMLSEISGNYSEDDLLGRSKDGTPPGRDENIFYEVEFRQPDGTAGERRRFTWASAPAFTAERFQWTISLRPASDNRSRRGELR